ncbi:MAG: DUF368 domain-containing protein [Candidatus Omnitrophica bacterium]|nr:DUF368 domain-containing protein [Candidatus Omnitrophota bacterium]
MGAANVIPGISGGTIAFILGIYERLIRSIKAFDLKFIKLLCRFRFKEAFSAIDGKFFSTLFLGVAIAIFTLSKVISQLLSSKPILIYSFFFGLILASIPIIARIIKNWTASKIVTACLTALATYFIVGMVPFTTPEAAWFVFLSGALAISTMILPGISGAFVLVLLGKYQFILDAVNQRDFFILGVFSLGMAVGILGFVRILSWLFNKYHDLTVTILTGIVVGSLRKIWPWKEVVRSMTTSRGKVISIEEVNILPGQLNAEVFLALVIMAAGFVLALMFNSSPDEKRLKS